MVNKQAPVKESYVSEGGFVSWVLSFRKGLRQSEEVEHGSLLSLLFNVFIYREEAYYHIWKPYPPGVFSTRSFTKELEVMTNAKPPCSFGW